MSDDLKKKREPLCRVCAQPASKLQCIKCKAPYCSISCQTEDWKKRGHKDTCKRLVKEKAEAAAAEGASRDEAATPPPSPKRKAAPPVVESPARGRVDVERARAAAAAPRAIVIPMPEAKHYHGSSRCPICLEDWDVNEMESLLYCCCLTICCHCDAKLDMDACPFCRVPAPTSGKEAMKMLRQNVDKGHPTAIRHLGTCYSLGYSGVVQSYKKATRLFQRAADLGSVNAMNQVGFAHQHGNGVKIDKKKMIKYYRMAADLGYERAQFNVANCYYNGEGVARDFVEAARIYKLASDHGHTDSEYALGQMHERGRGVAAADIVEATGLYERAAAKGHKGAIGALKREASAAALVQIRLLRRK